MLNHEREKLAQIDRALARIDDGTYGVCPSVRQCHREDAVDGVPACHYVHDMQAARGTSVDSDKRTSDQPGTVLTSRRVWAVFAVVAVVLYISDQLSKRAAVEHLTGRADVHVVGELFQLHLTRNPGAAFSLGTEFHRRSDLPGDRRDGRRTGREPQGRRPRLGGGPGR